MFIPEEHGVEVHYAASHVRLKLPARALGAARWVLGGLLVPFGLGFACLALSVGTVVFRAGGVPLGIGVTALLLAVASVLLGAALSCAGLGLLIGGSRCTIDVGPDGARVRERLGPFRWTFRCEVRALQRLEVAPGAGGPLLARAAAALLGGAVLRARLDGDEGLTIAPGYPAELLRQVAGELRQACRHLGGARPPHRPAGEAGDVPEAAALDLADEHDPA